MIQRFALPLGDAQADARRPAHVARGVRHGLARRPPRRSSARCTPQADDIAPGYRRRRRRATPLEGESRGIGPSPSVVVYIRSIIEHCMGTKRVSVSLAHAGLSLTRMRHSPRSWAGSAASSRPAAAGDIGVTGFEPATARPQGAGSASGDAYESTLRPPALPTQRRCAQNRTHIGTPSARPSAGLDEDPGGPTYRLRT